MEALMTRSGLGLKAQLLQLLPDTDPTRLPRAALGQENRRL